MAERKACAFGLTVAIRPSLAPSVRSSRDAIGAQSLQYLFPSLTTAQQIPHIEIAFGLCLAAFATFRPFASRFRLCVSRVAGALLRGCFDVIDQSVRTIPSAKGARVWAQISEVSESRVASELMARGQLPGSEDVQRVPLSPDPLHAALRTKGLYFDKELAQFGGA